MTGLVANTEGKIKDESITPGSLKEQVQVNRKCQYWKKGWTEENKRGRNEERCIFRERKRDCFSLLERFNQAQISAVNHKGLPLVCGSQRTS